MVVPRLAAVRAATVNNVGEDHMSDDEVVAQWQSVTSGVTRAQQHIDGILEKSGVPAHWFAVLQLLLQAKDHRLPMSVLAREVSMTSGGFTKLADRMARDGLIDRRGSSDDRRVVHAALSADGLRMAQQAGQVHRDALREYLLATITPAELSSAATTMRALAATLVDPAEADDVMETLMTEHGPARPERRGRGRPS